MDPIRLDRLLVDRGLVASRPRAERLITDHGVLVDGLEVRKAGKKVRPDATLDLLGADLPWVSRGALKLVAALDHFQLDPLPDTVVIDLSFISLDHVWPRLRHWLTPAGWGVALIKPQFEVGPKHLGRNGIVRDPAIRRKALEAAMAQATGEGFTCSDPIDSPIEGGSGNREFLLHFTWGSTG